MLRSFAKIPVLRAAPAPAPAPAPAAAAAAASLQICLVVTFLHREEELHLEPNNGFDYKTVGPLLDLNKIGTETKHYVA